MTHTNTATDRAPEAQVDTLAGSVDTRSTQRTARLVGAALLATAAFALTGCHGEEAERERPQLDPVAVTVSSAWSSTADRSFTGRVTAADEAQVATRTSGTLTSVLVEPGERVRVGQLLATLDDVDVQARIQAAAAQVELAEKQHGRISRLADDGAASQMELDQATAQLEAALAMLQEARAQADYVEVKAPFSGVVTARMADAGDLAVPGHPIVTVQTQGAAKVVADLPAGEQGTITEGMSVTLSHGGTAVPAKVSRVVPALDARSHRFRVEALSEGPLPWPAGQVVTLNVADAGAGTRWIPADAVVRRGQMTGVFTVEQDSLRLRWLRLGRALGDAVEVLAGPAGELTVVREPARELVDGQPVSQMQRAPAGSANDGSEAAPVGSQMPGADADLRSSSGSTAAAAEEAVR